MLLVLEFGPQFVPGLVHWPALQTALNIFQESKRGVASEGDTLMTFSTFNYSQSKIL